VNADERGERRRQVIAMTTNRRMSTLYRLRGYDKIRKRAECEFCGGNGHAAGNLDDPNECGFCD